jgi:sterol desaturase/sphingolipid hydroxylase (fatty acid hydroxylase superfamily)
MKPEVVIIFALFVSFITLEIFYTQFFKKPDQTPADGVVEVLSGGILTLFTQPLVVLCGGLVAALLFPNAEGILADWPFVAVFALFLVFDDLTQYWWHRLSHSVAWLYNLHRPHHNAPYLSIRVVYRNNFFYYLMMPGLWISGMLIYFGGGWVYAFYLVLKMAVIFGAHSDVRWDGKLYNIGWLSPVMWVIERTISTPATHSAHHGKHADDGITHYKGNYGNLLFLWDVIFGTAKITRRYPEKFGVENLPETNIMEQLFWPLARASKSTMNETVIALGSKS